MSNLPCPNESPKYRKARDAAFCCIAKAPADKINAWASLRGWSQIDLVSGYSTT